MLKLSENAHLPFDKLMALCKVEGLFGKLTVLSRVEPRVSPKIDRLARNDSFVEL